MRFMQVSLGAIELSWLNFVRDKIVLGAAKSMWPSHSKQIFFAAPKTILAEPFGQHLWFISTALSAFYVG
ncbi:conserved hypothetical protein [Vibrio crassostreae]|nr:conserved hypothetical protein [Vibrio crassostreae]CAK2639383.1 conserved hypothetical protein [Vibrio crassostreae]CAK3497249.1 conserved hypothetical protein [Vibrio crassostreae]